MPFVPPAKASLGLAAGTPNGALAIIKAEAIAMATLVRMTEEQIDHLIAEMEGMESGL